MHLFYGIEKIPKWNPTVMESKILKKIDSHTDIVYQVSAPGAGGLVASRDFVCLRCWKVIRNGNVVDDNSDNDGDDDNGDDGQLQPKRSHTRSQSISSPSLSLLPIAESSADEFNEEIADVRNKTMLRSLSKSLGAKTFMDDTAEQRQTSANESTEQDIYVDAKETQSMRSATSPDRGDTDVGDKLYLMTSVSVTYDRMPRISKYTRFVGHSKLIFYLSIH